MKFENSKVAVKEVGNASVNLAKANWRFVKAIGLTPVAFCKDFKEAIRRRREELNSEEEVVCEN